MNTDMEELNNQSNSDDHSSNSLRLKFLKRLQKIYNSAWLSVSSRHPLGQNIFSEDWDLLLILDACRVDALTEVASSYPFLGDIETRLSVGSVTPEWIAKTFTSEYTDKIKNTVYLAGNPFAEAILIDNERPPVHDTIPLNLSSWSTIEGRNLQNLRNVWNDGYDERLQTVPPRHLTDLAINEYRSTNPDRMIIHYTQPHLPYIGKAVENNRELLKIERNPWPMFLNGDIARSDLWEMYISNLRCVLETIVDLIHSVDASKVVITSDHGEAFGEWGAHAHPLGFPHPIVKKVPWAETSASNTGEYNPDQLTSEKSEIEREDVLDALGYL